jgi:alkylhydroperoxidase family enzyme
MISRLFDHAITKQEQALGVTLDYLREIAKVSKAGLLKLALLGPLGNHRKRLPKAAFHLARIVATQEEDCGACVQIAVNLALRDGVPLQYLRSTLERHYGELPGFLQEVCEFAESVSKGWDHPDARAKINERFGAEGLTELAFAIAAARVFPTIKRAMGYAQSCSVTGSSLNGKYVKQQTSGQGNAGLLAA